MTANHLSLEMAGFELLRDVSLELKPGCVTALMGPNGAGKTSLLRVLTDEVSPTGGEVSLNGRLLADWRPGERARLLAVLPQGSALNFPFTASEVVGLGRIPHDTGLAKDREIVRAALQMVDGLYLESRSYLRMSGGEKQRVQLARVLAQIWEPDSAGTRVLMLDEPTASLDLAHQQMMRDTLIQLKGKDVAVLIVLHDLNLAASCADRILMLDCGRILAQGSVSEVFNRETIGNIFGVAVDVINHPRSGLPMVIPR